MVWFILEGEEPQAEGVNSNAEEQRGVSCRGRWQVKLGSKLGILPKQFVLVLQILEIADLII